MAWQALLVFALGCIVGSFLNVCIHRLPRGESVAWPPSHCPRCRSKIRAFDNIPIISFFLLRGRCRICREAIAWRYPVVEALTGALLVLIFARTGWSGTFIKFTALSLILIPVAFIDLEHKLILNILTLPGILAGVLLQLILEPSPWWTPLLGLLAGGGFIYLVRLIGNALLHQESMGWGDLKLAAMIGAFIGPQVVVVLLVAFFLAAPVAGLMMAIYRFEARREIPFGPFMVAATITFLLAGDYLWKGYLSLMGL